MTSLKLSSLPTIVFILSQVLLGCEENPPTEEPIHNTIMVYCDFTTSLSQESAEYIQKYGEWIIRNAPKPSTFSFYEISRVPKSPFFTGSFTNLDPDLSKLDKELYELDLKDSLKSYVTQFSSAVSVLKDSYQHDPAYQGANSCITNAFSQADKYIRSNVSMDPTKNKTYLFVISDMIEECENSVFGRIYMNTKRGNQYENISTAIDDADPYQSDLHAVRPIIIQITRQDQTNALSLSQNEFEDLWTKILTKMGFTPESLRRWHFSPQNPSSQIW